jgi:hypothetical protein
LEIWDSAGKLDLPVTQAANATIPPDGTLEGPARRADLKPRRSKKASARRGVREKAAAKANDAAGQPHLQIEYVNPPESDASNAVKPGEPSDQGAESIKSDDRDALPPKSSADRGD